MVDVTARHAAEQALAESRAQLEQRMREIEHQALHDALTGLPNRTLFHDRVEQALRAARRAGGGVCVMLIDLDRFKEVNDTLGHMSGDVLLREVAQRLRTPVRESDTVARLGGDEFGVLATGDRDADRRPRPRREAPRGARPRRSSSAGWRSRSSRASGSRSLPTTGPTSRR